MVGGTWLVVWKHIIMDTDKYGPWPWPWVRWYAGIVV
jgi:hypothetical protein